MTFSGHAAVAALTLGLTRDPLLLAPLNFALHYAADGVPHAELPKSLAPAWIGEGALFCLVTGDAAAAYSIGPALIAVVAAIMPDLIDPFTRRTLPSLRRAHEWTHTWPQPPRNPVDWTRTVTGRTPYGLKLAVQGALTAGALAVIRSRLPLG